MKRGLKDPIKPKHTLSKLTHLNEKRIERRVLHDEKSVQLIAHSMKRGLKAGDFNVLATIFNIISMKRGLKDPCYPVS